MKRCHVCGLARDDFGVACFECGEDPHAARKTTVNCVPAHVPVSGYITFKELHELAEQIEDRPASPVVVMPEPEPSIPTNWFFMSMASVKWTGVTVTCLIMMFFVVVVLKAFM